MQGHIEDTGDCATCANEQTNATAYPCSDCATGELWEKVTAVCPACGGSGYSNFYTPCPTCNGTGYASGTVTVTTESHGTARVPEDVDGDDAA